MIRIPFDILLLEADRLIYSMAEASSVEMSYYYWDQFILYIESCGWTDAEFDIALLKMIDGSWEPNWN